MTGVQTGALPISDGDTALEPRGARALALAARVPAPPDAKAVSPLRSATAVHRMGRLLTRHVRGQVFGGYRRIHNQLNYTGLSPSDPLSAL